MKRLSLAVMCFCCVAIAVPVASQEKYSGEEDAIETALSSELPSVRQDALFDLVGRGDKAALPRIQSMVRDADARVRGAVALALGQLADPTSEPALVLLLKDKNEFVRREAAISLGLLKLADSLEPLEQALHDPSAAVRSVAAATLGEIGDSRAGEALIRGMKDKESAVRERCAHALGRLRLVEALPLLAGMLEAEEQASVRREAVWALGEIDSSAVTETLRRAASDRDASVRLAAAAALVRSGNNRTAR